MTRNEIRDVVLDALIDAGITRSRDIPLDTPLIGTDSLCLLEVEMLIEHRLKIRLGLSRLAGLVKADRKGFVSFESLATLQREAPSIGFSRLPLHPRTDDLYQLMTVQALVDLTIQTYVIQTAHQESARATR